MKALVLLKNLSQGFRKKRVLFLFPFTGLMNSLLGFNRSPKGC
jgi:hypothetical protein